MTSLNNKTRFTIDEGGMESLQVVSLVAIAAVILLSLVQTSRKSIDWMDAQSAAVTNEPSNTRTGVDETTVATSPIDSPRLTDFNSTRAVFTPGVNQPMFVLAGGGDYDSNGLVSASMKKLNKQKFSDDVIDSFIYLEFDDNVNTHLEFMKASELNKLVSKAAIPRMMEDVKSSMDQTHPKTLLKTLLQKIAQKGGAPYTWRLAQNLTPENWSKLMLEFKQLTTSEQKAFAMAFGSSKFSGQRKVRDGLEKLAAVTFQKGIQADAASKTETANEIADILDKLSDLKLPIYVAESFKLYAKVLNDSSKAITKSLTSPKSVRSLMLKIAEKTDIDMVKARQLTLHLHAVFKHAQKEESRLPMEPPGRDADPEKDLN